MRRWLILLRRSQSLTSYPLPLSMLHPRGIHHNKQLLKVKSPIVNTNNHLNEVFPSFDSLNKELSSGFHLVDTFSDYFSFYSVNRKDADAKLHIITNLIISTRTLSLIKTQFLLFWMLVLKKMLPLWSHIFIEIKILL